MAKTPPSPYLVLGLVLFIASLCLTIPSESHDHCSHVFLSNERVFTVLYSLFIIPVTIAILFLTVVFAMGFRRNDFSCSDLETTYTNYMILYLGIGFYFAMGVFWKMWIERLSSPLYTEEYLKENILTEKQCHDHTTRVSILKKMLMAIGSVLILVFGFFVAYEVYFKIQRNRNITTSHANSMSV
ncbi:hypothetical protein C9374_002451 [Naegleria lovaniensis]|uniref:Uncharacterized protein n=1 Tax=Naegleria lovaniensis TaxID=51637 RepID=A0AA88GPX2_NAELO|nr:uncharacterized protein C9374_002451 [Naegleria lovaniensis]KAG2386707.1 hypothetical protein C9374_002451 [Naegleria lovaniensis]